MKKLLAIAAMSAVASLGIQSAEAGTWKVKCLLQGPTRGSANPFRSLDVNSNVSPGNTAGYPIGARSIATQAEVAEASDIVGDMNFTSLGFGGQITLEYVDGFFANGPLEDITLYETTWGDPKCTPNVSETAYVQFSLDGVNWTPAASSCHNGAFDIAPLLKGKYVRITDITNSDPSISGDGVDAFDVDGLVANYDTDGGDPINPLCDYEQGVSQQYVGAAGNFPGRGIVGQRKFFSNANINDPTFSPGAVLETATPSLREASGWFNFWSIGFGGHACFQLPYTVFDGPGTDFQIFETTWNNKPCPNYPETVDLTVSVDGVTYSSAVVRCKDGALDLASFGAGYEAVNYIKFVDVSDPTKFGKGDDAFDIDNIYIVQGPPDGGNPPACGEVPVAVNAPQGGRRSIPSIEDNIGTTGMPEQMFPLEIVGSNIVTDNISFSATIAEEGGYKYAIRNHMGQELASGQLEGNLYDLSEATVSTGKLASGVYFLTLTSANSKETLKFVRK